MVLNDEEDSDSDDEPCCDGSDEEFGLYEDCDLEEDDEERANGIEERDGREHDIGDKELSVDGEEMCFEGRELDVGEDDDYDVRGEDSDDDEDRSITIVKGKGKHIDLE